MMKNSRTQFFSSLAMAMVFCLNERVVASHPIAPLLSLQNSLVFEDGLSVTLSLSAMSNGAAGIETAIVLSGVPSGWGVDPNGGTFDAATGTWTTALAPGESISEGPILSPPANSDADIPSLAIDVTSTDPSTGLSSTTSGTIAVTTDAVADSPFLSVADVAIFQGQSQVLDIAASVTDTDGSEAISLYEISGVPDGFSFSEGTFLGGGDFRFAPSEITGLELSAPSDFVGDFEVIVTAFSTETNLSDYEFDLTNNTATTSLSATITVVPEPQSIFLLLTASVASLAYRQRRRS